jgi:hypothetical protein
MPKCLTNPPTLDIVCHYLTVRIILYEFTDLSHICFKNNFSYACETCACWWNVSAIFFSKLPLLEWTKNEKHIFDNFFVVGLFKYII